MLGWAALLTSVPAAASRPDLRQFRAYTEARAADSLGATERAVRSYAAVLAAAPDNPTLASRALGEGIAAGDLPLALKAAHRLERSSPVTPDVRFLLLVDDARRKEWTAATAELDALGKDEVFSFMAPVLRAWIVQGRGTGDPLAVLDASAADPLAGAYVAQHRPLILMALGRDAEALDALRKSDGSQGREWRARLSIAASLVRKGRRDAALALLAGDSDPMLGARRLVRIGKPLTGEIATAQQGLAEYFLELSIDLRRQQVLALSLSFARFSTFLAPGNGEAWLLVSQILADQGQPRQALAVLRSMPAGDLFAGPALDQSVKLLAGLEDKDGALKLAFQAAHAPEAGFGDWSRLGDMYIDLARYDDAAAAYREAIRMAKTGESTQPVWPLLLLQGSALDQANKWPQAKAALQEAYGLAPDEPLVLNYLGYAQLARRENMAAAEQMVAEASRRAPDNAQITDSLGWAHYLQGDLPRAIPLLEKAAQTESSDAAINEHLGDAYYSAGRRFEARYAWSAALIVAPTRDAPRLKAKIETGLKPDLASP